MTSAYFESRILSADPIELIQILYEGALGAVDEARSNLARRNIAGRSAAIGKAVAILSELSSSLDHETGGEISRTLAELYDYMQRRLLRRTSNRPINPWQRWHACSQLCRKAGREFGTKRERVE